MLIHGQNDSLNYIGAASRWRFISLFVALPTIVVLSIKTFNEHHAEEECKKRPPYVPYEYLNIRTKVFFLHL